MDSQHFRVSEEVAPNSFAEANSNLAQAYSKTSMPVLRIDAHSAVVEAALKGYMKWRSTHGSKLQEDVRCPMRLSG
jgi:hypothetical protein